MIYYLFGRSWIENVPSATVELYTKIFQKFRLFNIVNLWGGQSRTTIWLKRDVSQIAAWLVGFVRDMKKTKILSHSSTSKPSTAWRKRGSQCIYERSALGLWVCLFIAFHPASKSRWSTGKSTLIAMWYNDMLAIWGTLKRKREANSLLSLHCDTRELASENRCDEPPFQCPFNRRRVCSGVNFRGRTAFWVDFLPIFVSCASSLWSVLQFESISMLFEPGNDRSLH